jgi:hyaluronoglucosaminidase
VSRPGRITVTRQVTVVASAAADPAALAETRGALRASGATTVQILSSPAPAAAVGLTVYVGRNAPVQRKLRAPSAAALAAGGYVLAAGRAGARQFIVLDGVDAAGQFYAAQTLRQLLAGRRSLSSFLIRDWPSFRLRGVVEGFYGRPWSTEARLSMLDFLGAHKLNLYTYTPKDDPYLRASWWTPYSSGALRTIGRLVARADRNHVTFNFGISPGLSICYSSASDEAKLIGKLRAVWAVGVRSFTVALDDIDPKRVACDSDRTRFGTGETALASAQADLLNRVDEFLATQPGSMPLVAVPTEYSGVDATPYKTQLATSLHPDITVQWTGRYGISVSITSDEATAAGEAYDHPLLIWDNFFVNDYAPNHLVLGAFDGRDSTLSRSAIGITADPMDQPEASKIGLFTMADYAWNSAAYNADGSWEASIREFSHGDASALSALRSFAGVNYTTPLSTLHAPALTGALATFWKQWYAGDDSAAAKLEPVLRTIRDAPARLRDRLQFENPAFVAEVDPWLEATDLWGQAAIVALDVLESRRKQLPDRVVADEALARSLRTRAQSVTWPGTTPPTFVYIGGDTLSAFVHYCLRGYGP